MNNKKTGILLIVLIAVIIAIVVIDFSSSKIDNLAENAYELNTDDYKHVDENLIHFKETRQIVTGDETPKDLTYYSGLIYLLTDQNIKTLNNKGQLNNKIDIQDNPNCIYVNSENIIVGYNNYFEILDLAGKSILKSEENNERSVFTSIAGNDSLIYVADAGNRKVIIYNSKGKIKSEFDGASGKGTNRFIVPSPYFDLAINKFDELWVANPGLHSFQWYDYKGWLNGLWEKSSNTLEGFTGCCNPAHFSFMNDGRFLTSEKKIVRIKIYSRDGILESVVAAPDKFIDEGKAPEVVSDENGNIIALDFDKKMIRFFEKK